ncbi:MAG: hypothetical protein V3S78_00850, partial [Hyphomicrobium sp.]
FTKAEAQKCRRDDLFGMWLKSRFVMNDWSGVVALVELFGVEKLDVGSFEDYAHASIKLAVCRTCDRG